MRDITERKATEEALQKSESRINSILRAAPVGIGVTSERVIQTVNKRLTEILGYPEEELLGRSSRFVYATQEDFDRVSREFRAHVKDPWGSVVEVQWKKKDDSIIDVLLSSVPVDSSDISKGVTFTALDITDRKRAGIALDKARNKMNVLRKITNEDIHNAVFSLSAYLHLMNPDKADGNVQEYIEKQVPLLQDIFESLNFAKEYQDMGIKPPRWQQVIGVFTYAVSHLNFLDINRKVSLDNLEIFADPMLEKAFFHLMQNSITHGVRVTEVCLSYQETKEGIRLIIEDNGVGIPDDKKKEIFQRGYRKSSGHGLFLVREILSITGMTITETGEPGKGARFEIMVPKGAYRSASPPQKQM
jgi:PAS domain S-box-containing protein